MERDELNRAFTAKTRELDEAMETGKSREELIRLYKELKELQFQKLKAELKETVTE